PDSGEIFTQYRNGAVESGSQNTQTDVQFFCCLNMGITLEINQFQGMLLFRPEYPGHVSNAYGLRIIMDLTPFFQYILMLRNSINQGVIFMGCASEVIDRDILSQASHPGV